MSHEGDDLSLLKAVVDASLDGIVGLTPEGVVSVWSPGAQGILGFTPDDVVGKPGGMFTNPALLAEQAEAMVRVLQGEPVFIESQIMHRDGRMVDIEFSAAPFFDPDGHLLGVSVVMRDVTRRKDEAKQMRAFEERARRAERADEQEREMRLLEERERIGRDLHDNVIQRLFATGVSLQGLANRLRDPDLERRVIRAVDEIDDTIRELRSAIFAMERGASGLAREAVEEEIARASAALPRRPRVELTGLTDSTISPHVVDQMLAVIRESLTNVARHAAATNVAVFVDVGDEIVLRVEDDGVGADDATATDAGGLGIANMRARAERLGGTLSIRPRLAGGTRLEWRVPRGGRTSDLTS